MKSLPKVLRSGIIQPKYVLAVVAVLMVMMVGMGLYEFSSSKQDIMRVLREEAMSLAEAVSIMSDNSLLSSYKIEDIMFSRLLDNARIIEHIDHDGQLSETLLKEITEQNGIYGIHVFDKDGHQSLSTHPEGETGELDAIQENMTPLLNGTEEEMLMEIGQGVNEKYAVGVRRRKGGAIVLGLNAEEMLEFRKAIGVGKLIQEIGENEGIEYIVLQDIYGMILASKNVTEMKKIAGDDFLENALENKHLDTRTYTFNGEEVLEVVNPFQIDDNSYGLFRIGLSMKEVRAAEARSRQRLLITALVVFVISIISFSFLIVNQNYSLLSGAYDRIQTYTGTVLENIADGIIVLDDKGNISVFNRAAELIFRKTSQETVGSSLEKLNLPVKRALESISNGENSIHDSEVAVNLPEAGNRLLSIRASRIAGTEAAEDLIVAIIRDVTEEKLMEENMRRTEQLTAMGKLASAVAHEVRNPLNSISMIAQRLGREFLPQQNEEKYRELTSMIRSESARLNGIIEEFLRFARPPKLNRQPIAMDKLLDETIALTETQAGKQKVEIRKSYTDLGVWIVDGEQMKQVLLNLFLNGIEAMSDGGVLSIDARKAEDQLTIEISDTGKGIPEEDLPRIFDLYFTTKETGTGLGLSIVQRVIMEHGGWVDVESVLNVGTTFRIYLPKEAGANE